MRELIEFIINSLVRKPDQVRITEINRRKGTIYKVTVAKEDLGKIIGKEGRTANSIRALLDAAGRKFRRRYSFEIKT